MVLKAIIIIILISMSSLSAQYIKGDFVEDFTFTDSNIDSVGNIVMNTTSLKEIIQSGKVLVISFFNPG